MTVITVDTSQCEGLTSVPLDDRLRVEMEVEKGTEAKLQYKVKGSQKWHDCTPPATGVWTLNWKIFEYKVRG